ncbi:hypothetical protein CDD83_9050 [Cordyceps sp. RAO-2017]|nr:hypothetical protein CDD83_9050 [Cordyceps sp. RAO-2017]
MYPHAGLYCLGFLAEASGLNSWRFLVDKRKSMKGEAGPGRAAIRVLALSGGAGPRRRKHSVAATAVDVRVMSRGTTSSPRPRTPTSDVQARHRDCRETFPRHLERPLACETNRLRLRRLHAGSVADDTPTTPEPRRHRVGGLPAMSPCQMLRCRGQVHLLRAYPYGAAASPWYSKRRAREAAAHRATCRPAVPSAAETGGLLSKSARTSGPWLRFLSYFRGSCSNSR